MRIKGERRWGMNMRRAFLATIFVVSAVVIGAAQQPRIVDLKATDGVELKASYFASTKPGPGVLLLHQCNRQRKVWDELATQLAEAGINTLTLDMRGFGESGGTRNDKRTPEEQAQTPEKNRGDIDIAFQYLVSQAGVTRNTIGVGGASCGVNNSIQTEIRHPNEVKSLVLLSGNADIAARQFLREDQRIPVLFAVADDDEYAPMVDVVEWLFSTTATGEKKFVHYQTGGHGADMFKVHPELRNIIVDWFVATLIRTPGKAPASPPSASGLPSATVLRELESPGGIEKVSQQLAEARKGDPKAEIFPEEIVNLMGYDYLQASDNQRALEILKLNVQAYPNSPNAYDSLSDAYLADGQKDLARENANKALALLAFDTADSEARKKTVRDSAEKKLKQLSP
jgi:dienelactone hydrolase